ncbi:MAG: hypothetical protein HY537_07620 [Deltaproteobacteria bacterium]|nr:hypothetical protein [Deltaproteobacteria bacterium]
MSNSPRLYGLAVRYVPGVVLLACLIAYSAPNEGPNPTESEGNSVIDVFVPGRMHALDFANRLIAELKSLPQGQHRVHVYHVAGKKTHPSLLPIIQLLSKAGIEVRGTLLSPEALYRREAELAGKLPSEQELKAFLVSYEQSGEPLSEVKKTSLLSRFSPAAILRRVNELKNRFFGLPQGIAFFEHFVERKGTGELARRFPPDMDTTKLAAYITLGGNLNLSGTMLLEKVKTADFEHVLAAAAEPEFVVTNAIVAAWVFGFVYFQREVSAFKLQGHSVWLDENAPAGDQIKIARSKSFFSASSIVQEWTLNALILLAVFGLDDFLGPRMLNGMLNGVLSAYSYLAAEHWKSDLLLQEEMARKAGDKETADRLKNRAWWIAFAWWNLVFPFMKNTHLLLTGKYEEPSQWLIALPFLCVGTACLILETKLLNRPTRSLKDFFKTIFHKFKRREPEIIECPDLIVLENYRLVDQ